MVYAPSDASAGALPQVMRTYAGSFFRVARLCLDRKNHPLYMSNNDALSITAVTL